MLAGRLLGKRGRVFLTPPPGGGLSGLRDCHCLDLRRAVLEKSEVDREPSLFEGAVAYRGFIEPSFIGQFIPKL